MFANSKFGVNNASALSDDADFGNVHGAGVGFRNEHFDDIFNLEHPIPWFELLTENHLTINSIPFYKAEKIRENYPVTLHGVGMSLGSTDDVDLNYLKRLKRLVSCLEPVYVSDHLSWVSHDGEFSHELLPLPYTEEALCHVSNRIHQVQDFLGRTILVENPSSYLSFTHSEMTEQEFVVQLLKMTGCDLLLDVNNLYVSATNLEFDPIQYISSLDSSRVKEIHLAGYERQDEPTSFLFDTHGCSVQPPVWALYDKVLALFGSVPTLVEWDTDIPSFQTLVKEAQIAQCRLDNVR